MRSFWKKVTETTLAQGDLLNDCLVPIFHREYGSDSDVEEIPVAPVRLIVVTQSCDLVAQKIELVAMCPIHKLDEFESENPRFQRRGEWEQVRKGRLEGLHLLASPESPSDSRDAFVVDFREIFSLPYDYLVKHAEECGARWRLDSPFLEHFSQAFARCFMRIGLPSSIPPFK